MADAGDGKASDHPAQTVAVSDLGKFVVIYAARCPCCWKMPKTLRRHSPLLWTNELPSTACEDFLAIQKSLLCSSNGIPPKVRARTLNNELFRRLNSRVPELIPDLGSQPAGDVSHKPGGSWRVATDGRTNTDRRTFPATAVGKTDAPETRPA